MTIQLLPHGDDHVALITADEVLIKTPQDALDLFGETSASALILHDHNFTPEFFDLSTQQLGNILQKFSNYQVKLAVIGDFDRYPSKVLKDFITESNRKSQYLFFSPVSMQSRNNGIFSNYFSSQIALNLLSSLCF